jgi:uncharacterized protein YacL
MIILRLVVTACAAVCGAVAGTAVGAPMLAGAAAGAVLGAAAVWLEWWAGRMPLDQTLWSVIAGILGAFAGLVLMTAIVSLPGGASIAARGMGAILGGYVGATVAWRRRADLEGLWGRLFPGASRSEAVKILDTSVIIDGRIVDVCEAGFVDGTLIVPQFVLRELQQIADSSDPLRRNRGRRGFDVLQRLSRSTRVAVQIHDRDFPQLREVDHKLIELAKVLGGRVLTNDHNLDRVAELRGVGVLNVNELAGAVKPVVLAGEPMSVRIVKEGKESGQGVGYLDDGTMVVVDHGKKHLGQRIDVTVTSVLQTSAGRLIFTRPREEEALSR